MPPSARACPARAVRRSPLHALAISTVLMLAQAGVSAMPAGAAPPPPREDAPPADTSPLTESQQRQIEHLLTSLRDGEMGDDHRRTAALILLDEGWPWGLASLKRHLMPGGDVKTQRIIAQAIAQCLSPSPELVEPLKQLLDSADTDLRRDVATALGRFDDPQLVQWLIAAAWLPHRDEALRRGAVRALGEHRRPEAVEALLKRAASEDPAIRSLAFDSLSRLAGVVDIGEDLAAWEQWWSRAKRMSPQRWTAALMQNISARNRDANAEIQKLTAMLTDAQTKLYEATPEVGREQLIQTMLEHPMVDVRLLGLGLLERRVLNAQPIPEPLKPTLRALLEDDVASVILRSAKLLETMADAAGARIALERLADDVLSAADPPEVQAAYLSLLSRVQLPGMADVALGRLRHSVTRPAAILVIIAAAEAKLLSGPQADDALTYIRQTFDPAKPEVMALRLLGHLGDESDEATLTACLQDANRDVRVAAADALGAERWPLTAVLDYLGDDDLGPTVMQIVARRGSDCPTLLKLIDAEPAAEPQQVWRDAVLAVVVRLDTEGLMALNSEMIGRIGKLEAKAAEAVAAAEGGNGTATGKSPADDRTAVLRGLLEQMLTAAAKVAIPDATPADQRENLENRRWEANYLLADWHLMLLQPSKVAEPLKVLVSRRERISDENKRRLALLELEVALHLHQLAEAEQQTARLLADPMGPSADRVAISWIEVMRALGGTAGGADPSLRMLEAASKLFNGKLSAEARTQLAAVRAQLNPAPPPPATAPGVPPLPAAASAGPGSPGAGPPAPAVVNPRTPADVTTP